MAAVRWERRRTRRGRSGAQSGASAAQQLLLTHNKLGDHVSADDARSVRIFTVVLQKKENNVRYLADCI